MLLSGTYACYGSCLYSATSTQVQSHGRFCISFSVCVCFASPTFNEAPTSIEKPLTDCCMFSRLTLVLYLHPHKAWRGNNIVPSWLHDHQNIHATIPIKALCAHMTKAETQMGLQEDSSLPSGSLQSPHPGGDRRHRPLLRTSALLSRCPGAQLSFSKFTCDTISPACG